MSPEESEPLEEAAFVLTTDEASGFFQSIFVHSGGSATDVCIRFGVLKDGQAIAGDGPQFGDLSKDVRIVAFDPERVDGSSVNADFPVRVTDGSHIALFLIWRAQPNASRFSALGFEATYTTDSGFRFGPTMDSEEAIRFMKETEIVQHGELSGSLEAVPEPQAEGSHFVELRVAGYRGFAQERCLRLARPTGSSGSGLTVIVGANNSGKSTFLESIQMIARARNPGELTFSQPRRHRDTDAVAIQLERSDGRSLRVETIRAGSSNAEAKWTPENASPDKFDIHVTPSRRQFSPYFGHTGLGDRDWGLRDQEFSRTQLRDQFSGRLEKVDREPEARRIFDCLLEKIIGGPLNWTIDEIATGQRFLKLIEPGGAWHTSEGLGDGLVSLLFIVDALYDSKPGSLVAIDEPELSLHPQLVRRLRRVLSEYAADRQIVIATHSPLLLDWSDVAAGATVARVYKTDGRSELAQASDEVLQKVARLADSRNYSNPHTVGTVAREAFFLEDGVILTEGQDDVAYLPTVLEDLGLPQAENIYGWGSGGIGNIPILASLFRELGFTRIAAVVDDDGQPGSLAAVEKLKAMAPEVLVRQIPAPDVRYKAKTIAKPEVVGLLDRDNTHVRVELREEATRIFREVLDHVTPPETREASASS